MQTRRDKIKPASIACCLALAGLVGAPADAATLTDAANRTVSVPAGIKSVVPAGPEAQVLLQALAPGLLAGLVSR